MKGFDASLDIQRAEHDGDDLPEGFVAYVIPTDISKPPKEVHVRGLNELQKRVGGYIELIPQDRDDVTVYCNEQGKIEGLAPNPRATVAFGRYLQEGDLLVGPVIITGHDPETGDLTDLPEDVQETFRLIIREVYGS